MRPLGQRRQFVLFLVAMLVPCMALAVLSFRMIGQERELAEKRRADQKQRLLDEARRQLLSRLENTRRDELNADRPLHPEVVFLARVQDRKLVLPWDSEQASAGFRKLVIEGAFERAVREGEREEFAGRRVNLAVEAYLGALRAARHPSQSAYARLLLARALDKAGRRAEALSQFRTLLKLPPELRDEEGVPLKLYAAERLCQSGQDRAAVLAAAREAAAAWPYLPPAACYVLRQITEKLGAEDLRRNVAAQIRRIEQGQMLQNDFPRLDALHARSSEPVWVRYGEEPWLVSVGAAPGGPPVLIAVRAAPLYAQVESLWREGRQLRFLAPRDSGGELLGENFPGLKVALGIREDTDFIRRADQQRQFLYFALALVLGAAIFGASILWNDLRRELRLSEVRAQFVSSVSHELKTPLTAIRMFAETLQMGRSRDPRTQAEYLDTIVNECERLSRLVDGVLLFSKIEQGKKVYHFRPASLAGVVEAAARALEYPLAQQGFELNIAMEDGMPAVAADEDALEQAVLNLLTNAMKYSGDSRRIDLTLRAANGDAVIEVTDHGVGIAPEEHARIFDKFYRAPTTENQLIPGTGLGLTLVAQIAKAHGGSVAVSSAPGAGSTFTIRLPMPGKDAARAAKGSSL